MKIYNFNSPFRKDEPVRSYNLWNSWKSYMIDLNNSVNSLYYYIKYFNPEYIFLNALPTDRYSNIDIDEYIELRPDNSNENMTIYYADMLGYKQGYIIENKISAIECKGESSIVFPTIEPGYVCINNYWPFGLEYYTNGEYQQQLKVENYLIAPFLISALYNTYIDTQNSQWTFKYHSNQSAFTNHTYFNFALYPLRYYYFGDINFDYIKEFNKDALVINNNEIQCDIGGIALNNNQPFIDWWSGKSDITSYIIDPTTYEEIIIDRTYDINMVATNQNLIANYKVTLTTSNNLTISNKLILL